MLRGSIPHRSTISPLGDESYHLEGLAESWRRHSPSEGRRTLVSRTCLESRRSGNRPVGSIPTPSAR